MALVQVFRNSGADQVQMLTPPAYLGTNFRYGLDDFTFEQQFKLTAATGANQVISLWGRLSIRQLGFGIDRTLGDGNHVVRVYLGNLVAVASLTETINLNQWYRVKASCRSTASGGEVADLYLDDGTGYRQITFGSPTPTTFTTSERFQLFSTNSVTSENPEGLFCWTSFWSGYYADGVPNDANLIDRWDPTDLTKLASPYTSFTSDAGQVATINDGTPTGVVVTDNVPDSFLGIGESAALLSKPLKSILSSPIRSVLS